MLHNYNAYDKETLFVGVLATFLFHLFAVACVGIIKEIHTVQKKNLQKLYHQ